MNNTNDLPSTISWADFEKIDIRVGTILTAEPNEKALKPAYKLTIDFGELGVLRSSAQITAIYAPEELVGMQVAAVVNFPPKQVAGVRSQCLVLGCVGEDPAQITLLTPEQKVKNGVKVG